MKFLMLFEAFSNYQTKVVDELLDKISKNGVNSLSPDELNKLKDVDNIKSPSVKALLKDDGEDETPADSSIFDIENIINKKYFDSTNQICFLLKQIEDESTGVVYFGDIHFKYKIYKGYLIRDKESESSDYKFMSEDGEEFEPAEHDLHYEFDGLIEEVFYDENINKNLHN